MRAPAHLVSSVCVGVCRYLAFGSWQRRWRVRDEGQGCEAPAEPACAERTSLTRVARSPKLAVKNEWRIERRSIDPVHALTFQYPGPEPDCLTRPVSEHDQPHIRSPLETAAPTSRLLRARAQANETILPIGIQAMDYLGSSTRIRQNRSGPGRFANSIDGGRQATFITAPSMRTPAVTYFHSATRSLRASATMIVFFMRPPLRLTRSLNQRASADCG